MLVITICLGLFMCVHSAKNDKGHCVLYTSNGFKLDLSSLEGHFLTSPTNSRSNPHIYKYTVCNDNIICNENDYSYQQGTKMAVVAEINNKNECVETIATRDELQVMNSLYSIVNKTFHLNMKVVSSLKYQISEISSDLVCIIMQIDQMKI